MAGAGVVFALALLTEIHAWFLIPIVGVRAPTRLRRARALAAVAAWAATGFALFALGWPWLWFDFVPRLYKYWETGIVRVAIQVQYFGRVYADRDVP
jgi:hypothetical protein